MKRARTEAKALIPEDAKEAIEGEALKSGAVSFDPLEAEAADAPVQ